MINIAVGKLIKKLRLEKEITMSDFAKQIKLSQSSLSRIENGTQELSLSMIATICEKLGISLSNFFWKLEFLSQDKAKDFRIHYNAGEPMQDLESDLINWIASLTDDQKKALYTLVHSYNRD